MRTFKISSGRYIYAHAYPIHEYMYLMTTQFIRHSRFSSYPRIHAIGLYRYSHWSGAIATKATKSRKIKTEWAQGKYREKKKCAIHRDAAVILLANCVERADSPLLHNSGWWPMHNAHNNTRPRAHTRTHTHTHMHKHILLDFTEDENLCEQWAHNVILFQRFHQHFILGLTARVKGHFLSKRF